MGRLKRVFSHPKANKIASKKCIGKSNKCAKDNALREKYFGRPKKKALEESKQDPAPTMSAWCLVPFSRKKSRLTDYSLLQSKVFVVRSSNE